MRPFIAVAAVVAAAAFFYFSGWGRLPIAVACGDGIVLDYKKQLNVSWEVSFIDVEIKVSNARFRTLEILGIRTPCPSCMEIEGVPASVPPLQSRTVKIHLPISHLPTDEKIPLKFKLFCDGIAPEKCECSCVLYREPIPVDDRVPTLAPAPNPASFGANLPEKED